MTLHVLYMRIFTDAQGFFPTLPAEGKAMARLAFDVGGIRV
jgi:hypothetical protein